MKHNSDEIEVEAGPRRWTEAMAKVPPAVAPKGNDEKFSERVQDLEQAQTAKVESLKEEIEERMDGIEGKIGMLSDQLSSLLAVLAPKDEKPKTAPKTAPKNPTK